ncbi:GAD-like domain-containing protein [Dyadobacter sandarakinus]|uniref:DUF1851 domain-containing protein n=1 Tax=Dyadobacter sandarakinus TaxID=2747268 RepID=A0ABX7I3F6_9BACT|nr:GAD-like domain-containing protein [Dyadobacter sandarakinus]QRR00602.1 DUF1851 domain-containing protein [Dyadobacter sandarakinus]
MITELKAFYEYNLPVEPYAKVPAETIDRYRSVLPDYFITLWEKEGLLTLKDRFFWLVNPEEYTEVLSWFIPKAEQYTVLLRTAFGGMVFFDKTAEGHDEHSGKEAYNFICPVYQTITPFTSALDAVLNGWLTTPEIYDPLMFQSLYTLARQELPAPEADEIYGFAPAIALGGDLFPSQVKVFKLREHLSFLSQLKG